MDAHLDHDSSKRGREARWDGIGFTLYQELDHLFLNIFISFLLHAHIRVWACVCHSTHVKVWRQPVGGSSLLQRCRFWELNTNPQLGWQVPSPPSPLTSPSLRGSILSIKPSELLNIINQFLFINRTWCCPLKMADQHSPVLKATCFMNPREPLKKLTQVGAKSVNFLPCSLWDPAEGCWVPKSSAG